MPACGIQYVSKKDLLSYKEIQYLVGLFTEMGISKLRITGGEPFVRKGIVSFLEKLSCLPQLKQINITTNGTTITPFIPALQSMQIHSVNLSLDSLDRKRFFQITRRDVFHQVMRALNQLLAAGISTKINVVVMQGKNIEDIYPMVELTKDYPISVRFIEEMPFNGQGRYVPELYWNYCRILAHIKHRYPNIYKISDSSKYATAVRYQIQGHRGNIGIIAAFSRTFCGACNRIRLTAKGMLKTCLYDSGVLDIKTLLRSGVSEKELKLTLLKILGKRPKNGFEAEKNRVSNIPVSESMSTIGG